MIPALLRIHAACAAVAMNNALADQRVQQANVSASAGDAVPEGASCTAGSAQEEEV
jgi:hypothetical protein